MNKVLHEVWEAQDGRTGLILAGEKGDDARKLFREDNMELVHTFNAGSHFEAMTIYYAYKGWGEYTSDFEEHDKLSYDE